MKTLGYAARSAGAPLAPYAFILPDCEMLRMDQVNDALERLERADVRYRFVIDMASLKG